MLPAVTIPEYIEGCKVTELADYCFAKNSRLPDTCLITSIGTAAKFHTSYFQTVTELCGSYMEHIHLPDTVEKIGDYAFYDCRNLSQITFGKRLNTIGSDVFMNCHNLHHLCITCSVLDKTSLRQILGQIPWDVKISFVEKKTMYEIIPQVSVFYPEYYETYDEIAPAHIFGRNIAGEGFRARQCFRDGILDFGQYDAIFQKACAEESADTLCKIAFLRLRYPAGLTEQKRTAYLNFVQEHGSILCRLIIDGRKLDALSFLLSENILKHKDIAYAVTLAAQSGWSEGSASILHFKQRIEKSEQHTRYTFEDF